MGRNDQALHLISFFLLFAFGVRAQPPLVFEGDKYRVQTSRLIPESAHALGFLESVYHYQPSLTPPAAQRVLEKLREGRATSTGWQVEIDGLKREAVILSWNLVAHPRAGDPETLEILGVRPTLFVPREGPIAIRRILNSQEIDSQSIRLEAHGDHRFLQRPSNSLSPHFFANDDTLLHGASERMAEGRFWILPGVVLLRDRPDSGESESFTGTLSSSIPCDDALVFPEGTRFLLTYRVDGTAEQIELPAEKLREALATLGAARSEQAVSELGIETLIVDLRAGPDHPDYYLLSRGHSRRDPLRVSALGESPRLHLAEQPQPLLPLHPVRESIVETLVARYMDWKLDRGEWLKPEMLFSRFLAEAPHLFESATGSDSNYSEMLVAVERLRMRHGETLSLPPITAGEFEMLAALNKVQSADPKSHPFLYQPKLTSNLRFRGGAAASNSFSTLYLNQNVRKKSDVLQVISQSATGRALLRKILPLIRAGEFQLVDASAQQPTAASMDSVRSLLRISRTRPLGEAVPASVRLMLLYLLDRPLGILDGVDIAEARRLALLRQSYAATQRILEELVRVGPALRFYVGEWNVPPDVELIREWGMTNARVEVENDRLSGVLRRCAEALIDKADTVNE